MHPVIAHFLDPKAVRAALDKAARGQALSELQQLFVTAADAHPERKARALKATAGGNVDDQQAALALAVFAALAAVEKDPVLGPAVEQARRGLLKAGATPDDVQQFLSLTLLEEAFGFDDEADSFDAVLVAETFGCLPRLAALDEERVSGLEELFVGDAPAATRTVLLAVAEALFSASWGEGPVPVSPEHVAAALEQLRGQTSDADFEATAKGTLALLRLLAREGLVGPVRLERLLDTAGQVARSISREAGVPTEEDDEESDPPAEVRAPSKPQGGSGTRN